MSVFDEPKLTPYNLDIDHSRGNPCIDVHDLVDILEKRAILSLRVATTALVLERTADFERGRFSEINEIYEALKEHV